MKVYLPLELAKLARKSSPFYRELYSALPDDANLRWDEIPVVDQEKFWAANGVTENRVVTGRSEDGIVFKSGGTTGNPKFSVFTHAEWEAFTRTFGRGLTAGGLKRGDRVANLFYAGELYASFIFIMKSIEYAAEPALQYPLGGAMAAFTTLKTIGDLGIDVWAGVPTSIMTLVEEYAGNRKSYSEIRPRKILFGGEGMYADQRARVESVFPGVILQSIGYASVDAGPLGFADPSCKPGEHRAFGAETLFEIVDEDTGEVIEEVGRPGRAIFTNLTRSLVPIIRYPAGDIAEWAEPKGASSDRKFLLLGRAGEAARAGTVSLYYEDARKILESAFVDEIGVAGFVFQIVVSHFERLDEMKVVIAAGTAGGPLDEATLAAKVRAYLVAERPALVSEATAGKIHSLKIEFVTLAKLEKNARTGKLKRVIDRRTS
jgi:phenylacetate-CoA ligase